MSLVEELLARNNTLTQRNIDVINQLNSLLGRGLPSLVDVGQVTLREAEVSSQSAYEAVEIDLTSTNTNKKISCGNCNFIQAWCDGTTEGITVKIGMPSGNVIPLIRFIAIPVTNPKQIYFTNDVRAGRSRLILYFVRSKLPLQLQIGGAVISQAELAARLGSIHTFDRRGEILWMDGFEDNLNKWSTIAGTVALSITEARNGAKSCKLVTGAVIGNTAQIRRTEPYPALSRMGAEISFINVANLLFFLNLLIRDGTNYYSASVRYTPSTTTLAISSGGAYVSLGTSVALMTTNFNTLKVVGDYKTNEYVRVILNEVEYDCRGYPLATAATGVNPHIQMDVTVETVAAVAQTTYIDDAIITQNEP